MSRNQAPMWTAGGNILPSSFIKAGTAADATCVIAGAGDKAIGISAVGTYDAPGLNGSRTYAGILGQPLETYSFGDVCDLVAGTGGWANGDFIMSDAAGAGITATSTNYACAVALCANTVAGQLGQVQIITPTKV